ncbi:ATP-binding protein [Paenibacillus sp. GCM10027626]|uniref:sensor histidine kinase n=1 Tax=Paenibacillus sp. GCM10027626 TaxID=3273411 RepID=UPI003628E081
MKLVHQINLAFALALVLVLSITGVIIHYVLLDHFIGTQKADLKSISAAMSATLVEADAQTIRPEIALPAAPKKEMVKEMAAARYNDIQAIITDEQGNVINDNQLKSGVFAHTAKAADEIVATPASMQKIWEGDDPRYVVNISSIPSGTLTLLSPISKIQEIERALLGRLILVIVLVGVIMFLISWFITKRLIKPLMNLQQELKKVKSRHFTDVQLVNASGEIGSVAHTVFEMAQELNQFNKVQKQFFQNASHELKTPIMSISGYAEGIRDGIFEGDGVRKGLDVILYESKRLGDIVTEMTLLAKLDSEEDIFRPSEVVLPELLTEAHERVNPLLVKKNLQLKIGCDDDPRLTIMADKDKLMQAVLNVIMNAVRHAAHTIEISALVEDGRIVMRVMDDGLGIPYELLPTVFHRFVKGKDGESGLGLAISRAIVERCGGMIKAENRPEGGAVVSFSFPVSKSRKMHE